MSQTVQGVLVRLRSEGRGAVVMAVPQSVRDVLLFRAGDMLVVRAEAGELCARKVDLSRTVPPSGADGGPTDDPRGKGQNKR